MSHVSIRMSLVALATSFGAVALASADGVKFESMAPKGSAMVVSLKNLNATAARLEASPLGQIMKAPEIESAVAQVRKDLATQRKTDLQALGIEAEEVPWPGPTGLAVFVERNEELDAPELGVLWWADYEGRADAAGEVFAGVIRELEKEAGKSFEQVDIQGGLKATRVVLPGEDEAGDPQDPQPPRRRRPRGVDAIGEITALPEAIYFIRTGSQFFAASNVPTLEDALTAASGTVIPCLAESDDWRGINTLVGESDGSIVLLTAPIQELLGPVFSGPMASAQVAMKEMFGDIRGWAITIDEGDGQVFLDLAVAAYIPATRVGLMEMLSLATPIEPPSVLLGDDAATFQRLNVRFKEIMAMIEDVVASLPEFEADAVAPMLQQYGPGLTKAFSSLGPEVSTVSRKAPDGVEGMRTFTAIRCSDEKTTNALLATILPSAGMMPRDFQGQIVYGGEGLGVEIGLGGGALIFGSPEAVEQALRSAGDSSMKSLAANTLYRQALSALAPGLVVGWGYADVPLMLDQNRKSILSVDDPLGEEPAPAPAEQDDPMGVLVPAQFGPEMGAAFEKLDHAVLTRYFGPLVWDLRSEAKGLALRAQWMRPIEAAKNVAK